MPDADYITRQNELNWTMRQTLIDWLIQLHSHYKLVPETLWIAVNILDRFLTKTTVSIVKFQLVGIVAMFIAAKYEEVTAPSAHQLASSTDGLFTKKDVSQGEKFVLKTLEYEISQYCSPYNWMRKTSKADDYDVQTRTLSKFLTEVTLLDYRFLRVKSSLVAAVGMYTARRMLGRDWVSPNCILVTCRRARPVLSPSRRTPADYIFYPVSLGDGVRVPFQIHGRAALARIFSTYGKPGQRRILRTICLQEICL